MKKNLVLIAAIFCLAACKKNDSSSSVSSAAVTEQDVLNDFTNVVVNPDYQDLEAKAFAMNSSILALSVSCNDANLATAQSAWRSVRVPWEQSEGFLFGPVEDYYYDPSTDSWPVNTVELDSLLASTNSLTVNDIEQLQDALKGYHPIEYLLFGVGGTRVASELGARQLQYLVSLSVDLDSIVTQLRKSWDVNEPGNFSHQVTTAGQGSTRFTSRQDAFLTIVDAMEHICNEVANSKMETPLQQLDSTKVESQYAHNATLDFTNNIVGLQNVYMGKYGGHSGHSLHDLVSAKNASLDNEIQSQITVAIASLQALDANYGLAIFTQQSQIGVSRQAINDLHDKLDLLRQFVQSNIVD